MFEAVSPGHAGFAAWEIDILLRRRMASDMRGAAQTLQALVRLMNELPNLEMPDFIGLQARLSTNRH